MIFIATLTFFSCWLALLWLWETLPLVGLWLSAGGLPSGLADCRLAGMQLACYVAVVAVGSNPVNNFWFFI